MRRAIMLSVATLSLAGGVIGTWAGASGATDTTVPESSGAHPLIGVWMVTDTSDPEDPSTFVAAFSPGGVFVQVEGEEVSLGAWEATGPTSAAMTFSNQDSDEEGGGSFTVRAAIEVAADGQSFTAEYTVEVSGVDGVPEGEFGPGSVTGERVAVEPMGTPVGSFEDLFGAFEEPTGDSIVVVTEVGAPPTTS